MEEQGTGLDRLLRYMGLIGLDEADFKDLNRLVIAALCTDISASLALQMTALQIVVHAAITALACIGLYLRDPRRRNKHKPKKDNDGQ